MNGWNSNVTPHGMSLDVDESSEKKKKKKHCNHPILIRLTKTMLIFVHRSMVRKYQKTGQGP
jgi:hypothetical protein